MGLSTLLKMQNFKRKKEEKAQDCDSLALECGLNIS